jgi:proteasome lid subunit RPN8/RPN11
MMVRIASTLLSALQHAARESPDREVCGLLFGDLELIAGHQPATNVATDPSRAFEIDPAALFAAHRAARTGGPALIGHYHSHPTGGAAPSLCDAERADEPGAYWLILTPIDCALFQAVDHGPVQGRFIHVPLLTV